MVVTWDSYITWARHGHGSHMTWRWHGHEMAWHGGDMGVTRAWHSHCMGMTWAWQSHEMEMAWTHWKLRLQQVPMNLEQALVATTTYGLPEGCHLWSYDHVQA